MKSKTVRQGRRFTIYYPKTGDIILDLISDIILIFKWHHFRIKLFHHEILSDISLELKDINVMVY